MGQRTPLGTYTNEPSVNTAELSAAKKLSLYGTTEPRYCRTRSGYSRIASEMAQKIPPPGVGIPADRFGEGAEDHPVLLELLAERARDGDRVEHRVPRHTRQPL